jgi:hypothetical protein
MGAILDRVGRVGGVYPASAYRWAFLACLISAIIALIGILFMKETFPKPISKQENSPPLA